MCKTGWSGRLSGEENEFLRLEDSFNQDDFSSEFSKTRFKKFNYVNQI